VLIIPSITRTARTVQTLTLTVLPHGGQRSARRNAWASMAADNTRAQSRREADAAMARAVAMSQHPAATAR
jgi:hypothetical protein